MPAHKSSSTLRFWFEFPLLECSRIRNIRFARAIFQLGRSLEIFAQRVRHAREEKPNYSWVFTSTELGCVFCFSPLACYVFFYSPLACPARCVKSFNECLSKACTGYCQVNLFITSREKERLSWYVYVMYLSLPMKNHVAGIQRKAFFLNVDKSGMLFGHFQLFLQPSLIWSKQYFRVPSIVLWMFYIPFFLPLSEGVWWLRWSRHKISQYLDWDPTSCKLCVYINEQYLDWLTCEQCSSHYL